MKLLTLRFKNLNSLYGEWEIDFTALAQNGGIFSITGPTGSGKTTVLDAVSLALYGRTPRLEKITGRKNEIMSKNTSECYAEATFQTFNGTYRSHWSQRRSANGEYKTPRSEIFNLADNTPAELGIEALTGINSTDFERLVVLAQGRFTAFLYANENEKAFILENLTNSEIYRRISQMVYERCKEEEQRLAEMKFRADELVNNLLPPEKSAALEQEISVCKLKSAELIRGQNELNEKINSAKQAEELREEIDRISRENSDLAREEESFKQDKLRLDLGERAAMVIPSWSNFTACQERVQKNRTEKESISLSLIKAERETEALQTLLYAAEERYKSALKEFADTEPKIKEARELDLRMEQYERELKRVSEEISLQEKKLGEAEEENNGIAVKIEERKKHYESLTEQNRRTEDELTEALLLLTEGRTATALAAKREEYLLKAGLSEHREHLEEGKPCPLCGSVSHPFKGLSRKFSKELEELENIIKKATEMEERLNRLKESEKDDRNNLEKELIKLNERGKALSSLIEIQRTALSQNKKEAEQILPTRDELNKKRSSLLGDRSPDLEENRLKKAKDEKDTELKRTQAKSEKLRAELSGLKARSEEINKFLDESIREFESAEESFKKKLMTHGLENQSEFQKFLLDGREIARLKGKESELADRRRALEIKKSDRERRSEEFKKALTDIPPLKELKEKADNLQRELIALAEQTGSISRRLKENQELKSKADEQAKQTEDLQRSIRKWSILNTLIGSAKGDKFAKLVQSLNFGDLLNQANTELMKISSRYRLIHGESLEIQVIDNEQNAWIRPARNLSGGESFIVSLALALGLSSLSRHKTSVDILFLDEGFGTLDSACAETALTALTAVKGRKKVIGLISHLDMLKEKIAYQIKVEPIGEGKSILTGIGVKKIE
ncbi:MAG: AAA family ATPase [Deferribacteraceae bacterium]|jgi:exonuclease SbcC|nr:AAA family ATPase [Deferribacteraceae bacterium]